MTQIAQFEQMAAVAQERCVRETGEQKTAADTQSVRRRNQPNNH